MRKRKRLLVLEAIPDKATAASYHFGYTAAFANSELFDVTIANVITHNFFYEKVNRWSHIFGKTFDAIVLMHSTFASSQKIPKRWMETLRKMNIPIVWFIGNEFYRMPQKMQFAEENSISILVSQCFSDQVLAIYKERLGCKVIGMPTAAFDTKEYSLGPPISERPIDIGYRMMPGPASFGHWEREDIADAVSAAANGRYITDISMRVEDRFNAKGWKRFLQKCKTQLSVASGGNIFELSDTTLMKSFEYTEKYPNATREEIATTFPPKDEWVPLRTLSSRMVEAAATGTPQIMYAESLGIELRPGHDFIELRKDHDNLNDVMDRVGDVAYLEEVARNCFVSMRKQMTYEIVLGKFDKELDDIL